MVVAGLPFAFAVDRLRDVCYYEAAQLNAHCPSLATGRAEVDPTIDPRIECLVGRLQRAKDTQQARLLVSGQRGQPMS